MKSSAGQEESQGTCFFVVEVSQWRPLHSRCICPFSHFLSSTSRQWTDGRPSPETSGCGGESASQQGPWLPFPAMGATPLPPRAAIAGLASLPSFLDPQGSSWEPRAQREATASWGKRLPRYHSVIPPQVGAHFPAPHSFHPHPPAPFNPSEHWYVRMISSLISQTVFTF